MNETLLSGCVQIIESKEFKRPTNSILFLLTVFLGCKIILTDAKPLLFVLSLYNNM